MPVHPVERKLAAIFAADIAGYSRLMARDEVGTLARLKACRVIIDELIASHRGRIFNTAGDSVVADFASVVDAVQCAVAVQAAIATEDAGGTTEEPMQFRIGVHVGDIMVDGENLLGDGVNIAARLESLAEPGTICVSAVARDQIGNKLPLAFDDLGEQQIKTSPRRSGSIGCELKPRWHGRLRCCLYLISRRSRCCRSRTCRATRSRNISPTAWSRMSSPLYRAIHRSS